LPAFAAVASSALIDAWSFDADPFGAGGYERQDPGADERVEEDDVGKGQQPLGFPRQ
jgi:hypothetical protein